MGAGPVWRLKPSDPTITSTFNTYRFAYYKEKVIDLLAGDYGERGVPASPGLLTRGPGWRW